MTLNAGVVEISRWYHVARVDDSQRNWTGMPRFILLSAGDKPETAEGTVHVVSVRVVEYCPQPAPFFPLTRQ
jgi:hypothetical protein